MRGLEETVNICKKMFSNERSTYQGRLYQIDNVLNSPQPIQRPIPIMVGGGGEKVTLKIAARYANISHFNTNNLEDLERKISVLREHCNTLRRDYHEIRKGTSMSIIVADTGTEAEKKLKNQAKSSNTPIETLRSQLGPAVGTPKKVADYIKKYLEKGITLLMFRFSDINDLKILSKEVIPQL
ncbi:MAG: LLM class flavin-dependent oxidoreductase [Candidatus Bathyarchaeota archaeon]